MTTPAVADALADPVIRRHPVAILVYWYCLAHLSPSEMRRMRLADICRATGRSDRRAGTALALLVTRGYLVRGPKVLDRLTYRLATPEDRARADAVAR